MDRSTASHSNLVVNCGWLVGSSGGQDGRRGCRAMLLLRTWDPRQRDGAHSGTLLLQVCTST